MREAPDFVARVKPYEAYFHVVQGLMPGARMLAASQYGVTAFMLVSGHTLECLLKAILSKDGIDEDKLRGRNLDHNLVALWECARTRGLVINSPPSWAEALNGLHESPFAIRYLKSKQGVKEYLAGWVGPNIPETMSGLEELFEKVGQKISVP
jgi:hypothetical protein